MFKFMKSKKGFSLVELMIVVVIMAILVAVAVPIFNSVTGSSRAKTCIDNQRSIISTLNNALLEKTLTSGTTYTFYVENSKANGKRYLDDKKAEMSTTTADNTKFIDGVTLAGLFQTVPYCPVDDSLIKVDVTGQADGTCKVTTNCEKNSTAALSANGGTVKDPHDLK